VKGVIEALYTDARTNDPIARQKLADLDRPNITPYEAFHARKDLYMPVNPEFGNLLYSLVRSTRAKTVVEFGTSFGISTLFLAAAVADNSEGQVITTEFIPEKTERAKKNLSNAGLDSWVDFRVGDALEVLKTHPSNPIDFLFLDGAKNLYLPVLKLLEPRLKSGALIVSDNTDMEGVQDFLAHIRNPERGYLSSPVGTSLQGSGRGHEVTVRL
jgi:predicted O-methyltransferase YrrM